MAETTALAKVTQALGKATKKGTLAGLKATEIETVVKEGMWYQIAQALPRHLSPDRMIQICVTEIARNPKIAECSIPSIFGAIIQASILGFSPASSLGECYFVPFWNSKTGQSDLQFMIGYKGYMKLARQSDMIAKIYAECVYKGDKFKYLLGLHKQLEHEPVLSNERKDADIEYVYAVCIYKDGLSDFIVLTRQEVERLRLRSPSQKAVPTGAWLTDYAAMSKAKAVKQLAKWLPLVEVDMANVTADPIKRGAALDESVIPIESLKQGGAGADIDDIQQITDGSYTVETEPSEPEPEVKPVKVEPAPKQVAPTNAVEPSANAPEWANPPVNITEHQAETIKEIENIETPVKTKAASKSRTAPKKEMTIEEYCKAEGFVFEKAEDPEMMDCYRGGEENHWLDIYQPEDGFIVLSGTLDETQDSQFNCDTLEDVKKLVERWKS